MSDKQEVPPIPETGDTTSKDERMWAMFCHLIALSKYLLPIPFAGVIGPLVLWLIKKDEYSLVDDQGKEAINFQISISIYFIISAVLVVVLVGFALLALLTIFELICIVVATVKANDGVKYRYPLCIRFIR